jgi:Magnesium chelatase, subunit ChlI
MHPSSAVTEAYCGIVVRKRPKQSGTSRLACRLTTMPPDMTVAEAIETTCIHRVAGRTGARTAVVTTRPFLAPHHTISDVGLIREGQVPMLGQVTRTLPSAFVLSWLRHVPISHRSAGCADPHATVQDDTATLSPAYGHAFGCTPPLPVRGCIIRCSHTPCLGSCHVALLISSIQGLPSCVALGIALAMP